MTDNDNQKTVHTSAGMFGGMTKGVYCCKCCESDLTNVNKLEHKCEPYALFRTALKYRQMLEDICNSVDLENGNIEALLDKDTINLARDVLGWEKI